MKNKLNLSCLLSFIFLISISLSNAATFNVTNTNDAGSGSLREAIGLANANPDADVINVNVTGTVNLSSQLPAITESVTINGNGLVLDGGSNNYRVMEISGGTVVLNNLTVQNGTLPNAPGDNYGGGVYISAGTVSISNCSIIDNVNNDAAGGGLAVTGGSVSLNSSNVSDNTSSANYAGNGGGIYIGSSGLLSINNCTISGNSSPYSLNVGGGGIFNRGEIQIRNSTISENSAGYAGGGIVNYTAGVIEIVNSTISGNTAGNTAGGILHSGAGNPNTKIYNCTISGNSSSVQGAGCHIDVYGEVTVKNTIITGNTGAYDVHKASSPWSITDQGYNIIGEQDGNYFNAATDILWSGTQWERNGSALANQNLNLAAALADNGGPTQTLAITAGSFAIGAGFPDLTTDQRNYQRLNPPTIGAYEYGAIIPTLGEWGVIALSVLMLVMGGWFVWRRIV